MENFHERFLRSNPTFMSRICLSFLFFISIACHPGDEKKNLVLHSNSLNSPETVAGIALPPGFKRVALPAHSFGEWLRSVPLKKDNLVHLYNGELKADQSSQFAVLDIRVGTKDLQQCADAILRLRAEYFLQQNRPNLIAFRATDGTVLSFPDWKKGIRYKLAGNKLTLYKQNFDDTDTRRNLESFLETVFSFCGTLSLSHEMHSKNIRDINPGDVFVKGGSPGHAMVVMDVAINEAGKKIFILAQSYMPAQDIHIVKNPMDVELSPWYNVNDSKSLVTPGWVFDPGQIKEW
jgi:hypothetical protein